MEHNTGNKKVQQYFKFQNEVMFYLADDFDYMRDNGIYKHDVNVGSDVSYSGFIDIFGKNSKTYIDDGFLTQTIKPQVTKMLCRIKRESTNGFDSITVITPQASLNRRAVNLMTYDGYSDYINSNVGALNVEYSPNEDPDVFLENLFQTIASSKDKELKNKIINDHSMTSKKLSKLKFIAKLTHLIKHHKSQECSQEK